MPFTGDFDGFKRLRDAFKDLVRPDGVAQRDIAKSVIRQVRGVLKEEFRDSEGPDGKWKMTVRGKPALRSKKLPQDFEGHVVQGGVKFTSRIPWLRAHHEGHVFPAQSVGALQRYLTFNKKGKLIKRKRLRRGGYQTFAKAHRIGARVLPARPMYPEDEIRGKWAFRINLGAGEAMARWYNRANRR